MAHPELTLDLTAEDLIRVRFAALKEQNFSLLYASYHPRAPFLEQFPTLNSYREFAVQTLSDLRLYDADVGASRVTPEGVEIICILRFDLGSEVQILYELVLVIPTDLGWRYHSAQKLSTEDYQGEFAALDFVHFDHQSPKIRF
ncbi:hypothetical protein [Geopsychrobacter electrodiphilus]|uniref:hypothetical protein n=1 Tax=Geopsychrobacter electrodiphilus TaxID=225196 RepID=UPI00037375AE|nr:hypothetical protein [Geopsychrobacter electrodiphilus]